MSEWTECQLGEITEILDSRRVPVREEDRLSGPVPYYGANGQQGWIDRALFDEPLILLAEDGGHFDEFIDRPIAYRIDGPSWVNNHAHVIRSAVGVHQKFLFWSLRNRDIRRWIAGGTRSKLTQGEMRRITLQVPLLEEQRRIAEILDTVDETIQATERTIAKRKNIRAGLATHLLSGRNSEYTLEDWSSSEIPDRGSPPQPASIGDTAWYLPQRLENIADLMMGQSPAGSSVADLDSGLPFLQGNSEFGTRHPNPIFQCDRAPRRSARGDSLISVRAPVGDINRSDRAYGLGRGLAAVRFDRVHPGFGHYALMEVARQLDRVSQGTTFSAIGRSDLAVLEIAVPPLEEQRRIAGILDTADETIRSNERQLEKLCRLRSGLADDLLSGRVRTVTT